MKIIPSNDELTVVQRWLQKLIAANKERDELWKRYERTNRGASKPRKYKPRQKARQVPQVMVDVVKKTSKEKKSLPRGYYGFVYLMQSSNGYHKVGITTDIKKRLNGIRRLFPVKIDIVHHIASNDYRNVERFIHKKFASKRVQHEWFNLEDGDVRWFKLLRDYDLDPFC